MDSFEIENKKRKSKCDDESCNDDCSNKNLIIYIFGEICDFIRDIIMRNIKHLFHILVIILYPGSFYRFFIK
jgi:hypothetical protein